MFFPPLKILFTQPFNCLITFHSSDLVRKLIYLEELFFAGHKKSVSYSYVSIMSGIFLHAMYIQMYFFTISLFPSIL